MAETIFSYATLLLSFLFCFVMSKLEQKKKNTRHIANILFFPLIIGLFRRISVEAQIVSKHFDIHYVFPYTILLGVVLAISFVATLILKKFFGELLIVRSESLKQD